MQLVVILSSCRDQQSSISATEILFMLLNLNVLGVLVLLLTDR